MTPRFALPAFELTWHLPASLRLGSLTIGRDRLIAWSFAHVMLTPILLNLGLGGLALVSLVAGEAVLFAAAAARPSRANPFLEIGEANTLAASAYLSAGATYVLLGRHGAGVALIGVAGLKLALSVREGEPCARLCAGVGCLLVSLYLSLRLFFAGAFDYDPLFARTEIAVVAVVVDVALLSLALPLLRSVALDGSLHPAFAWAPLAIAGLLFAATGFGGLVSEGEAGVRAWLAIKAVVVAYLALRTLQRPDEPFAPGL
jgi:hypothetical protein